jgi:uncharacterized protein (DUF1697 family)
MARYVAFLRAINIGGRRVTNDDLRACFETVGLDEVSTFRASGNVIFDAPGGESVAKVTRRAEEGLERSLGYEVVVFLRTAKEVITLADHDPFPVREVEASKGKLQVDFLLRKPTAAARKKVLALATDEDRLALRGRELWWLPSGGLLDSDLDLKAITAAVGPSTRRTKGTVEQIAGKYLRE